jgi:transposase
MTANRIGIDFSQDYFDLIVANAEGQPITAAKRFVHDRQGSQEALNFVIPLCQAHPAERVWIGGEATGLLWWHLYQQWALDPHLAELNPQFYLLNPAPVKGFRKSAPRQDKTDAKDARLITRYLGIPDQELHAWQPDAEFWALRFLTRARFRLAHQLARFKLQAYNMLYIKASAYRQIQPFSDVLGKTSIEILRRYPSLDALACLPLEELSAELDRVGHGRLADPDENVRKLQQVARHSYPLHPQVSKNIHFILGHLLDMIETVEKKLKAFDSFIAEQYADNLDIAHLDAIGGIGLVYASGLVAELYPTQRFFLDDKLDLHSGLIKPRSMHQAQAAAAKLAGLWWPRNQSGNFDAQDRRLPHACNPYLRYFIVEATNHVRENVAEYGQYYARKFAESKKHPHRRAIILTARKLLRLVFVLLHNHQAYQPRRHSLL